MSKVHVIQTPESTDNNDNSSKSLPSNWILENKVSQIDLFLIGVTIVIGGQFNGFNAAFDAGYAIAIFNILVTGIGYLCLTFCLAEMTSALPFSGGVYGFVRAFIHPWAGFLIACYELVLNLFYVAYAVYSLAKIPLVIANHGDDEGNDDSVKEADAGLLISYCLVIYVIIGCTCLVGGRLFWSFNNILACVVLGLLFIYLFGSLPNVDFNKWATSEQIFNDYSIFAFLAQSSGNYLGIQYLPLMSKDIENPRKNIPRAMIGGMLLFVLTAVGLITISCSQSPGITAIGSNINYPLSYGFQDIFSITLSQAKWLSIPGLFSMAFGFLFCYARQSLCMAQSGFLPKCFTWTTPYLGTPYVGLFCGISLCLLINVISFYSPLFLSAVSNISILAGYIVFIATAFAYLIFSSNYSSLSREFSSPLGKFGAVITILIFLFCSIGILGYEPSNISLYVMIAIFIIPSFYYFLFIANHQIFSDEEKDNLFKAYVVNGKFMILFSISFNLFFFCISE